MGALNLAAVGVLLLVIFVAVVFLSFRLVTYCIAYRELAHLDGTVPSAEDDEEEEFDDEEEQEMQVGSRRATKQGQRGTGRGLPSSTKDRAGGRVGRGEAKSRQELEEEKALTAEAASDVGSIDPYGDQVLGGTFENTQFQTLAGCNTFAFSQSTDGHSFEIEGEIDDEVHPDDSVSMAFVRSLPGYTRDPPQQAPPPARTAPARKAEVAGSKKPSRIKMPTQPAAPAEKKPDRSPKPPPPAKAPMPPKPSPPPKPPTPSKPSPPTGQRDQPVPPPPEPARTPQVDPPPPPVAVQPPPAQQELQPPPRPPPQPAMSSQDEEFTLVALSQQRPARRR